MLGRGVVARAQVVAVAGVGYLGAVVFAVVGVVGAVVATVGGADIRAVIADIGTGVRGAVGAGRVVAEVISIAGVAKGACGGTLNGGRAPIVRADGIVGPRS